MRLGIKLIKNYANINHFEYTSQWSLFEGTAKVLYFQLVDLDKNGLRYIPTAPITVTVTFPQENGDTPISKTATNPSTSDLSVFQISILTTDSILSGNFFVSLTDATGTYKAVVKQGIVVDIVNQGGC